MRFTLDWLREYCRVDVPPAELSSMLTMAGCKVEGISRSGEDLVFEVEITANRPDYLGVLGIAREVALLTNRSMTVPSLAAPGEPVSDLGGTGVAVEDFSGCPRYVARVLREVKVGPSPAWLQRRLAAVGLRPVNNVVDITNYVMWETGQPLHAFDLDRLEERRIVVRRARAGETMVAIKDAVICKLNPSMLVIADARNPVAIAGVMGGKATEVTESTRAILLESAAFDPASIRRTSRALGLASDSSYRFERGVDVAGVEWVSRRATELMAKWAGATAVSGHIDVRIERPEPARVRLRFSRLHTVLGRDLDRTTVLRILEGLSIRWRDESADAIECTVPTFRADLRIEVDLIEEVARIYGYERIPSTPRLSLVTVRPSIAERVESAARECLVGLGGFEALTHSFAESAAGMKIDYWSVAPPIAVPDPRGKEARELRKSLVPGLIGVQRRNDAYSEPPTPFFEIARIYTSGGPAQAPFAERRVCGMIDPAGFRSQLGRCAALAERLGIATSPQTAAVSWPGFRADRCVKLRLGETEIGYCAELSPETAYAAGLRGTPAVAELDFDRLTELARLDPTVRDFTRLPFVQRDLAIIVDDIVTWREVQETVLACKLAHLESIEFFDEYRGAPVPAGRKSLAFSLRYRSSERTLTSEEVDASTKKAAEALAREHRAVLRSQ